jgi:hypothetical protein
MFLIFLVELKFVLIMSVLSKAYEKGCKSVVNLRDAPGNPVISLHFTRY